MWKNFSAKSASAKFEALYCILGKTVIVPETKIYIHLRTIYLYVSWDTAYYSEITMESAL